MSRTRTVIEEDCSQPRTRRRERKSVAQRPSWGREPPALGARRRNVSLQACQAVWRPDFSVGQCWDSLAGLGTPRSLRWLAHVLKLLAVALSLWSLRVHGIACAWPRCPRKGLPVSDQSSVHGEDLESPLSLEVQKGDGKASAPSWSRLLGGSLSPELPEAQLAWP